MKRTRNAHTPSTPAAAPRGARWHTLLAAAVIVFATLVVYIPAYSAGWSWDDDASVYANPLVTEAGGLQRIWLTTEDHDVWPLTRTAFRLEYALFGDDPAGYHVVNVVLHALVAVLVFLVLARLEVPGAALAGLVFAVHPVNASTAAWVAELKNILSTGLLALTALAWLRYQRDHRPAWYAAALVAFAAALAAKTAVAPWPAMMLGLAWWLRGRVAWRDVAESLPFFTAAAAMAALTVIVQGRMQNPMMQPLEGIEKVAGAGWVFWFYVGKAIAPVGLCAVYPHWKTAISAWGTAAFVPSALLAATVAGLWMARRTWWGRGLLTATGYSVLAMAPVMGFFGATFTMHSLVADHFQYLPCIGVIAAVCAGASVLVRRYPKVKAAAIAAAAVAVCALGAGTAARAQVMSTQESLWTDTVTKNPGSWLAHYNLGTGITLAVRERVQAMLAASQEAGRLAQEADAQAARGDQAGAAVRRDGARAKQQEAATLAAECRARSEEAAAHYRQALAIQPLHVRSYVNLGLTLSALGRVDEALAVYREGADVVTRHYTGSENPELWVNFCQASMAAGRAAEAIEACRTAARLMPGDAGAARDLAQALTGVAWRRSTSPDPSERNGTEALALLREAAGLVNPPFPALVDAQAAALAEVGRLQEAAALASSLHQALRAHGDGAMADGVAARAALYASGQPYRSAK